MKITFLGTGGMVPTKDRNVQAMYLEYKGEGILIDCGEGTQRQMNIAGINRLKVRTVLISHWHGDHVAGLIGLIQTLGNVDEPKPLRIFGPSGTKHHLNHLLQSVIFDQRLELIVEEIEPSDELSVPILTADGYTLFAGKLEHKVPCVGYSFHEHDQRKMNAQKLTALGLSRGPCIGKLQKGEVVEHQGKTIKPSEVSTIKKGKKITFILDTEACPAIHNLAKDADLLISEANFASNLEEKASKTRHLTAQVVAQIAVSANVKRLILTHFSQRYKSVEELEEDAKKVFPNTTCAYDFMEVKI